MRCFADSLVASLQRNERFHFVLEMSNLLDFCLLVVGYCELAYEDGFDNVCNEGIDKDNNPNSEIVYWVASASMV